MGACWSQAAGGVDQASRQKSLEIDKRLEEDGRRGKSEYKILLLGSGESGKSTIVKQMKIIHQNGYTRDELFLYRLTVIKNLVDSAQTVALALRRYMLEPEVLANREFADRILEYEVPADAHAVLPTEMGEMIASLWSDPVIPRLMQHSGAFYIMDNADYFFESARRIASPTYVPNERDVLHARSKTVGVTETRFSMGELSIHLVDVGGQRSERRKWIHCFEAVTSILFCVALSEYDQVLLEDSTQNRMAESLVLFESVVNSRTCACATTADRSRLVCPHVDCAAPQQDRHFPAKDSASTAGRLLPRVHGWGRREQGGQVHSLAVYACEPRQAQHLPPPDASNGHEQHPACVCGGERDAPAELAARDGAFVAGKDREDRIGAMGQPYSALATASSLRHGSTRRSKSRASRAGRATEGASPIHVAASCATMAGGWACA